MEQGRPVLYACTVEIQHKDPFLADKGAIEHVLAVEDDVVPFDRADVLYQGGVDAFLCEISRKHRPRDLLSLRRRHSSMGHRRPEEYAKEQLNTGENIDPDP